MWKKTLLFGALIYLAFGCSGISNINADQFWIKKDVINSRDMVNSIKGPDLTYEKNLLLRPPYYNGAMPLVFKSFQKNMGGGTMGFKSLVWCYDFGKWRNIFIYKDSKAVMFQNPSGAIAINNDDNHLIAECKVMKALSINNQFSGFEIKEVHYNNKGQIIFASTFEVDFPMGFKRKETSSQGKKERDYFFIWPFDF